MTSVPPLLTAREVYVRKLLAFVDTLRHDLRAVRGFPGTPDSTLLQWTLAADQFGGYVLRDQQGAPLDLHPLHRLFTAFTVSCWTQGLAAGILAPWRHGKSLWGPLRLPLLELGRDRNTRVRLVCGDDREAVLRVSAIRRFLMDPEYALLFPEVRPARMAEWTKHSFFVERDSPGPDPSVSAAGVFNAEAGGGNDLLIFDDVATYQNMLLRPAVREKVTETLDNVWLRRVDPGTRVLMVGTRWHTDDPYGQLMRRPGWLWLIVRVGTLARPEGFDGLSWEIVGKPRG